ncbi:thiolase family protein [Caballeronia grimmiae]|uniref:Acetyl-CoA acetyltransferase n=1 Tax=Caballeronia grimmiae TaxID=1071679 RepID=A0A069NE31_9BURK|nr:acetyl-CoA C-acyltransferase [Caballeronia grimmiae]KDR26595.1 acetyl-CoA acetyltransferase [Caballeronia grimmiae]GGD96956.1 acetyl-CoA acetyltransferase [Caballeronia grimmiae]
MLGRDVVICAAVRTAIGSFNGSLRAVPATELGATAIKEAIARSGLGAGQVGGVVMGNVVQAGNKMNPARQASINAGIPVSVPALSVNRVCGSGAQAVVSAAHEIWLGVRDAMVAGGMENMDMAPFLLAGGRWGYRMGHAEIYDSLLRDGLEDAFSGEHSGWHTEDLVAQFHLTRESQDRWATRSQQRFSNAQRRGLFREEIVPVSVAERKGVVVFEQDEAPRPDTSVEALAKLKPAFRPEGTITAGNAPGLNSGAAALVLAERKKAEATGIEPLARLAGYAVSAVEPGMFGLGPVPAIRTVAERVGWALNEVQRFEINEAFAAVPLAVIRELGIDSELVNVEGGAVAHGHPIGATGAILVTRLIHSMRRDGLTRGIVSLCIGGGQGIALALETL